MKQLLVERGVEVDHPRRGRADDHLLHVDTRPGVEHRTALGGGEFKIDLQDGTGRTSTEGGPQRSPWKNRFQRGMPGHGAHLADQLLELDGQWLEKAPDIDTARDRLRAESMRADIVIREAPGSDLGGPAREEYWLRVAVRECR